MNKNRINTNPNEFQYDNKNITLANVNNVYDYKINDQTSGFISKLFKETKNSTSSNSSDTDDRIVL